MAQKKSDAQIVMTDSMSCPGQATKPVPILLIPDRAYRRLSVNYFTHDDKIFFVRPIAPEMPTKTSTCAQRVPFGCTTFTVASQQVDG
jgi:hypothetical protein